MVRCRRKYYLESCPWHFLVPNLVLFKTKTFKGARLTAVCNRWSLTSINGGGGGILVTVHKHDTFDIMVRYGFSTAGVKIKLLHLILLNSVTPLLKKPTLNTSIIENYKPISLLQFIAKTLKQVVFNQVSLFLSQNNKLDANQSGFRSGHSIETALFSVTEALRIAKADSKSSVLILLDLSAAFDTVNHQILLSTLSSLDITGIPLCLFESISLVGLSRWPGRGGIQSTWTLYPSTGH